MASPVLACADYDFGAVMALIRSSFAYMEARIDPPSSMHRLTAEALATHKGEVWVIEDGGPVACVVLTPLADVLYLGKLAVHDGYRGRGLARDLVGLAEGRARDMGLGAVQLQVRIELVENQALFERLGFAITGHSAHDGYTRPTSVTMGKSVAMESGKLCKRARTDDT